MILRYKVPSNIRRQGNATEEELGPGPPKIAPQALLAGIVRAVPHSRWWYNLREIGEA